MSTRFILMLAFLSAGACGIVEPGVHGKNGQFRASVTGTMQANLKGTAEYGRGAAMDPYPHNLSLYVPGGSSELGIYFNFGEAPQRGMYRVVAPVSGAPPLKRGETRVSYYAEEFNFFRGVSGELRITSTNPLQGTFAFEGDGLHDQWVTVQGEFDFE